MNDTVENYLYDYPKVAENGDPEFPDLETSPKLDVNSLSDKVKKAQSTSDLDDVMKDIENAGALFPYLPYTNVKRLSYYLAYHADYDFIKICQALATTQLDFTDEVRYFRLVPYQVGDDLVGAVQPVTKEQLLKDLRAFQKDNGSVAHEAEHAPKGFADKLLYCDVKGVSMETAQHTMDTYWYFAVTPSEIQKQVKYILSEFPSQMMNN